MKLLSRKEELLLLAIWKLQDNAYGVTIRDQLINVTNKYWSIGAVYDVLDRLARKGLVTSRTSLPVSERGGKSKRFYSISKRGHEALKAISQLHDVMWADLPIIHLETE